MNYLLFFIYLAVFCWLLTKIKFIRNAKLGNRTIIILFLFRVLAGMAYGWVSMYYYPVSDSVGFHVEGVAEYHLLLSDPADYLTNLFTHTGNRSYTALFDSTDSFWNNLRSNIIIKLLSVFDVFTNHNYFINILFYNFLVFFGSISLYRIFIQIFPERKNTLLVTLFLLPSFLYFTSGIHRDGLIFLSLGIVCYNMFCMLKKEGTLIIRLLLVCFGISLIFLLRNFVFIVLIPALAAWILTARKKNFIVFYYLVTYTLFIILFFTLKYITPKLDLPQAVSSKQIAFIEISRIAASSININPLFPDFRSFFNNTPQGFNHALMRPYLSEVATLLYIPAAIEIFLFELVLLAWLIFRSAKPVKESFIYFGIFFSLSMFLLIGLTIPILGAIVRYRSIYFPFFITPLACLIDINKIKAIMNYK